MYVPYAEGTGGSPMVCSDFFDDYEDSLPPGWDDLTPDEQDALEDAWRNGTLDDHPSLSASERSPSLCS